MNSSTTGHIDIEINLEKYEIQFGNRCWFFIGESFIDAKGPVKVSDFQEYVLFVEEIEEEPGDGKISYAQQQGAD